MICVLGSVDWKPAQEQEVVSELLTMWDAFLRKGGVFPTVRFLTVRPPGPLARYAFSDEPRGVFETLCMLRFPAPYAVEPDRAHEIAPDVRSILRAFYGRDIDPADPGAPRPVDEFVLRHLRGRAASRDTIEELDYWPRHTALGLGCLVGEMLRRHGRLTARWIRDEDVPFQLGIEVALRGAAQVQYSAPIGKVCMLFEDGVVNSIENYVRDIPAILRELSPESG